MWQYWISYLLKHRPPESQTLLRTPHSINELWGLLSQRSFFYIERSRPNYYYPSEKHSPLTLWRSELAKRYNSSSLCIYLFSPKECHSNRTKLTRLYTKVQHSVFTHFRIERIDERPSFLSRIVLNSDNVYTISTLLSSYEQILLNVEQWSNQFPHLAFVRWGIELFMMWKCTYVVGNT